MREDESAGKGGREEGFVVSVKKIGERMRGKCNTWQAVRKVRSEDEDDDGLTHGTYLLSLCNLISSEVNGTVGYPVWRPCRDPPPPPFFFLPSCR